MTRRVPWLDDGGKLRRRMVLLSLLVGFMVILGLMVYAAVQLYLHEGERSKDLMAFYNVNTTNILSRVNSDFGDKESKVMNWFPTLLLSVRVIDIIPSSYTVKLCSTLHIKPDQSTKDFKFFMGNSLPVTIPANRSVFDIDYSLQTDNGDINRYPFDKYELRADYGLYDAGDTDTNITFGAVAYGELQNWRLKMDFYQEADKIYLDIVMKRSPSTRIFSTFVVILMWMVTISVVCITFHFVIRRKEVTPPLLGAMVTLLFALPAIRNIQPNVPPIGTVSDVAGLFFNMVLMSICFVVLIVEFMWQSPDPHVPPTPLNPLKLKI